jgi:hypothetical protein
LKTDGVHAIQDGATFGCGWDEFEEAEGVSGGEQNEQNGSDAVEPSGFHLDGAPSLATVVQVMRWKYAIVTNATLSDKP